MIFKKWSAILLPALLVSQTSWSQMDTLRWHRQVQLDAKRFNIDSSRTNSYVDISVHYRHWFQQNNRGRMTPLLNTNAILSYNTSYLPDSTEETLRRAKLLFDLSGYHSKLLKARVYELGKEALLLKEALLKLDGVYLSTRQEIAELQRQISEGIEAYGAEGLMAWETKMETLLGETPDIAIVEVAPRWQLGIFLSGSQEFFGGKTGEAFKNATGGGFGIFLDAKRSRIMLDMSYGGSRTNTEIDGKGHWDQGIRISHVRLDLLYGWKLVDKQFSIVPYIGYGVSEFSPVKKEKEDRRTVTGFSPVVGFEVNRKFKQRKNYYERTTYFVKASTSVNPSNFIKNYAGSQVNVKLAFGILSSKVKTEMVRQ